MKSKNSKNEMKNGNYCVSFRKVIENDKTS